jgi:hypothetical protein
MPFTTVRPILVIAVLFVRSEIHLSAQGSCEPTYAQCEAKRTIIETPSGLVNGRNGAFTVSLTPASGSHVVVFRTGLRLTEGIDYQVIDRQILMTSSSLPQPGDVVTAVYRPSLENQKSVGRPALQSRDFNASAGGDVADMGLREALDLETKAIETSAMPKRPSQRVSALSMMEGQQVKDRLAPIMKSGSTYIDGRRNHRPSSPQRPPIIDGVFGLEMRPDNGAGSKALKMLNERVGLESKGQTVSTDQLHGHN